MQSYDVTFTYNIQKKNYFTNKKPNDSRKEKNVGENGFEN